MKSWSRKGVDLLLAEKQDWDLAYAEDQTLDTILPARGSHAIFISPTRGGALERAMRFSQRLEGPWILLHLVSPEGVAVEFAVWRSTGAVYRTDGSAVRDDPFLVPEGSPYDGPLEGEK